MATTPRLLTFRQFAERHPAFTEAGLRWLRFNGAHNGFGDAFVKIGSRVLIDQGKFFAAIEQLNPPAQES